MNRLRTAAFWTLPPAFCLVLYWLALRTWFLQDDFAWLLLAKQVREGASLLDALFTPKAQGTIRFLSERAYFLAMYSLFGLDALPFRVSAFLTQFANLALAAALVRRMTGSAAAGFWTAILWAGSAGLVAGMTWASAYNQLLCAFFLLASLHLLLKWIETGRSSYYAAQWITFLAGFGALELTVVYPLLALLYTWCCARRYFVRTLPLLFPSLAFCAAWLLFIPRSGGVYTMHFGPDMIRRLWQYWAWSLGPAPSSGVEAQSGGVPYAVALALTLLLTSFVVWKIRRREWLAVFLAAWFPLLLAPVLPLREHVSYYYLALPSLGTAMLGGWAIAGAWRTARAWRVAAAAAAAAYLAVSVPVVRYATQHQHQRSRSVRLLVRGVQRAHELHPDKTILLTGVSTEQVRSAMAHSAYVLAGARHVYLAPDENGTGAAPASPEFTLPPAQVLRLLEERRAVVYRVEPARLVNFTSLYHWRARLNFRVEEPRRIVAGEEAFAGQLGPGWHAIDANHRWMGRRATLRLGGPRSAGEQLHITGYCPELQKARGPVHLTVSVEGRAFPPVLLTQRIGAFEFAFPLAKELAGKEALSVSLEVDRTITAPGDPRDLGALFGTFEIR